MIYLNLKSVMARLQGHDPLNGNVISDFDWLPGDKPHTITAFFYSDSDNIKALRACADVDDLEVVLDVNDAMFNLVDPKILTMQISFLKSTDDSINYDDYEIKLVVSYSSIEV